MNDSTVKTLARLLLSEKLRAGWRERVYAFLNRRTLRRAKAPQALTPGIALWGMAAESSGMGQCCRSAARALLTGDIPFALRPLHSRAGGTLELSAFAEALAEERLMSVNLFCFNADCTGYFLRQAGAEQLKGRKNIALWAWELPEFPKEWSSAFEWYDEIWTISEFCRAAIARATDKRVRVLPLCVEPEAEPGLTRGDFGLPEGRTLFLAMYDARSIQERKNPGGALAAYCAAFPEDRGETALILKIGGGEQGRQEADALRSGLGRSDILILEDVLSEARLYALMSLCDVFISLHRSEGFGFPIAEAMALGLPAVVTGYSGNMDFCTPENSVCVGYTLRPLGEAAVPPYGSEQLWAEPDIPAAACALRRLHEDRAYRQALGLAGQTAVRERCSAENCFRFLRTALEESEAP